MLSLVVNSHIAATYRTPASHQSSLRFYRGYDAGFSANPLVRFEDWEPVAPTATGVSEVLYSTPSYPRTLESERKVSQRIVTRMRKSGIKTYESIYSRDFL